jgi:diphthamide synthase (EF-2-diphthine--ammonia ligase)
MIDGGLRALITCIDPKQAPAAILGKEYDKVFLDALPESVDPCGENGEFHSFVFDGPMFDAPIDVTVGQIRRRDEFVFVDVLPAS